MTDTPNPQNEAELSEILLDLRRHLAWQEAEGPRMILDSPRPASNVGHRATPLAQGNAARATPSPTGAAGPRASTSVGPASARVAQPALALATDPPRAIKPRPTLDEVRVDLGECTRCKLCSGRTQIVFGVGNPRAELVFVGEGPGADEDAQGVPFVGKAGQLLTKMIEAMGFARDEVYICNVVKCRPPGNRNPEPDEIAACEPFLQAQLRAIGPKVIVGLGKFAVQTLLRDPSPISRIRGNWREYEGIKLMPTFHPAYLLRDPSQKKLAWADLQQVMSFFGKKGPGSR